MLFHRMSTGERAFKHTWAPRSCDNDHGPFGVIYHAYIGKVKYTKTDVTPAILSRDFGAQLYRAAKLQYTTVHVAHCDFVTRYSCATKSRDKIASVTSILKIE